MLCDRHQDYSWFIEQEIEEQKLSYLRSGNEKMVAPVTNPHILAQIILSTTRQCQQEVIHRLRQRMLIPLIRGQKTGIHSAQIATKNGITEAKSPAQKQAPFTFKFPQGSQKSHVHLWSFKVGPHPSALQTMLVSVLETLANYLLVCQVKLTVKNSRKLLRLIKA